jgi:surface antigen
MKGHLGLTRMLAMVVTMKPARPTKLVSSLAAVLALLSAPAMAEMAQAPRAGTAAPEYLQCVPYARQVSGIRIYGDAHTWWDQAEGRYARGNAPRVGAVMAFVPHRNMLLGHVAAVSRVIDSRNVLLRHANWSEIGGRRGQIEDDVRAVDVSPANDWSQVRVWYAPSNGLGTTAWPVRGFIYPDRTPNLAAPRPVIAQRAPSPSRQGRDFAAVMALEAPRAAPAPARSGRDFSRAMAMDELVAEDSFEGSFAGLR